MNWAIRQKSRETVAERRMVNEYNFWRPSAEQCRTILLLEALGLIHDLGKLSDTFLLSQDPSPDPKYENYTMISLPTRDRFRFTRIL